MTEIRWKQRFENFEKAFLRLKEGLELAAKNPQDQLYQEGMVQRFEYTFELGWKTLKDYLEYSKISFDEITPRKVIKAAFAANILPQAQTWIDMLDDRNLMAHTYQQQAFNKVIAQINNSYFAAIAATYVFFKEKLGDKK